jgi:hypothetical protein
MTRCLIIVTPERGAGWMVHGENAKRAAALLLRPYSLVGPGMEPVMRLTQTDVDELTGAGAEVVLAEGEALE